MSAKWNSSTNLETLQNSQKESIGSDSIKGMNINDLAINVSKDAVAAAGFDVKAPIVDALIGNIKGTFPTKKSDATDSIRCEICNCDISSNVILEFHINGAKHKKKLKALEIIAQLKAGGEKGVCVGDGEDPNSFRCELCNLTVNSAQQLDFHLSGSKHKKKAGLDGGPTDSNVGADNTDEAVSLPSAKKKKKEEPKLIACEKCNVTMNSEIQYQQHLSSKKHLLKSNQSYSNSRKRGIAERRFIKFKSQGNQYFNSKFSNPVSESNVDANKSNMNKPFPYSNFVSNCTNQFNGNPFMNGSSNSNGFKPPFKNLKFIPNDHQFPKKTVQFRNKFNMYNSMPPYVKSGSQGFMRNSNF